MKRFKEQEGRVGEGFKEGPNCRFPGSGDLPGPCKLMGKCIGADEIRVAVKRDKAGNVSNLPKIVAGSGCQNEQAIAARQEASTYLESKE
jgi:hypothetical protein